ncbi:hypothetical protein GCM10027047_25670 [Rhodococcus aerolatus]
MLFHVRWPDGTAQACYSPSLVVTEHLEVGARYPVADFVARTRAAMTTASERVQARYGFPCSRAAATLAQVEAAAARAGAGEVRVERFDGA